MTTLKPTRTAAKANFLPPLSSSYPCPFMFICGHSFFTASNHSKYRLPTPQENRFIAAHLNYIFIGAEKALFYAPHHAAKNPCAARPATGVSPLCDTLIFAPVQAECALKECVFKKEPGRATAAHPNI
jgi:hypothetical protein